MQATNNDNPVLNNPYEEPKYHYDTDLDGNLDYSRVLPGRRPYTGNIDVTPSPRQGEGSFFTGADFAPTDPDAPFINAIREEVKRWRQEGYPRTTRVTRTLLNYWFDPHRQNNQKLFFCQREAVETAVYLNEVADADPNVGRDLLRQLDERLQQVSDDADMRLPRTAFKMATGTGKTVVMAMLILYNYLNKREYHNDTRFVDHFLIVTPGVTIRERLGVLYIDNVHANKNERTDYYTLRGLIPRQYEPHLGGLNSAIIITNYQQLEPKTLKGKHESPTDGKVRYDKDGNVQKDIAKESYPILLGRMLKGMKGKRLVVINDEAHHCYLPKNWDTSGDEEANEGVEENKYAMIWYKALQQMNVCGYKIQHVYDLSATPYYRKGSGYEPYTLFPWVVSDFGLVEAIESGLVKIPFFPALDTTADEEPKFLHLYEHIRTDIPKMGLKGKKKIDKEDGRDEDKGKETAPQIPALLRTALDQFYKDYQDYEHGLRGDGESSKDLFSTPPVFIVVCNNTYFSKEVYKELAGWETTNDQGEVERHPSQYDLFSNYDLATGLPRPKSPTLLVDSVALDNAADVVDDDFKRIYAKEIEAFKREYAIKNGGNADKLKDSDIMREIVNSVGKPDTLGADIRCVVSVGMLTEGWDANTVTHVCGIRAFGSQLLCEQVVGRALRRRSYDLVAYNTKGEVIAEENIKRYKPENITYKFPPEYAHIIGVPFKNFKGGSGTPPPPAPKQTTIQARKDRSQLEIKFPNVTGYKSESIDERIEADYTGCSPFVIDFRSEIPQRTLLASPINDKNVIMQTEVESLRDQYVIYYLTRLLIDEKYSTDGPQFQKFNQLKEIVSYWYDHQIQLIGGEGDMRRMVIMFDAREVVASIYAGIHQRNIATGRVRLTPILNFYNPEGSSRYVWGKTSKPTLETTKSQVDKVAAEEGSWQEAATRALEECPSVVRYVRNHYLEFYILYFEGNSERNYMPDFVAVVKTADGREVSLLMEISHFARYDEQKTATIRRYVCDYWLTAVNTLQKYGRWELLEITDVDNLKEQLTEKILSL